MNSKDKSEAKQLVKKMYDEKGKLKPGYAIHVDEKSACNALREHEQKRSQGVESVRDSGEVETLSSKEKMEQFIED